MTEVRIRRGRFIGGVIASLALAACGGGGGGGAPSGATPDAGQATAPSETSDATPANPGNTPAGTHKLFVTDTAHGVLALVDTLAPAAGSTLSASTLSVPELKGAVAYDSQRDLLYVASGASILVFAGASTMSAASAPKRTISLAADFLWVDALQLDVSSDVLFVAGARYYDSQVLVFAQASTLSGAAAPARSMTFNDGMRSFAIDTRRSILYAVSAVVGVHVYTGIDTASGVQQPNRHMLNVSSTEALTLDAVKDRLYVTDVTTGVHLVDNASTTPVLTGTLALKNAYSVALDSVHDNLYVGAYDKAYVIAGVSRMTGPAAAPAASLVAPSGTAIGGFAFA